MKKIFVFCVAMTAMFLMSADVYSSAKPNPDGNKYCVYYWTGRCYKSILGDACYLVDTECNFID